MKENDIITQIMPEVSLAILILITVVLTSNPVLRFLFGVSTNQLWSMIEGMQLIVNYPMLKVNASANLGII